MQGVNTQWVNETGSPTISEEHKGWPIRRDDSYPFSNTNAIFINGFYTTRPHIKKFIREATQKLHSSLRLTAQ